MRLRRIKRSLAVLQRINYLRGLQDRDATEQAELRRLMAELEQCDADGRRWADPRQLSIFSGPEAHG